RADPPVYEGTRTACVDCHRTDFDHSTFPGHSDFGTGCVECHNTTAWRSKTWDRDPEPRTADAGGDAGADVADASAGPVDSGAEPSAGRTTRRTTGGSTSRPRTPRTGGTVATSTPTEVTPPMPTPEPTPAAPPEAAPGHPESAFPIRSGNHTGISCRQCHSGGGAMGRSNTNCVQCHPRSRYDDVHGGVGGYPQGSAAPNFCVNCHRHGTRRRN
ncbi:MAG: hypothetical protein WCJ30_27065, partial [Deltaproteobacteria bacterium]